MNVCARQVSATVGQNGTLVFGGGDVGTMPAAASPARGDSLEKAVAMLPMPPTLVRATGAANARAPGSEIQLVPGGAFLHSGTASGRSTRAYRCVSI